MKQLIAVSAVLFEGHNYRPGDELPTHNAGLIDIWTGNKTAVWKDAEEPSKRRAKAKRITAPPGLPGEAYPCAGSEQDLVGKPPSRKTRGAQPQPAKGRRKSSA